MFLRKKISKSIEIPQLRFLPLGPHSNRSRILLYAFYTYYTCYTYTFLFRCSASPVFRHGESVTFPALFRNKSRSTFAGSSPGASTTRHSLNNPTRKATYSACANLRPRHDRAPSEKVRSVPRMWRVLSAATTRFSLAAPLAVSLAGAVELVEVVVVEAEVPEKEESHL